MKIQIPTFNVKNNIWKYSEFNNKEEFVIFLKGLFKEPGQYKFDETTLIFNEEGRRFQKDKVYTFNPKDTKGYRSYWDDQKEKCRNGIIVEGSSIWYLSRYYYMWLNFLPIYNKEINKFSFADVRDAQYHMALYEDIARFSNKHAAILKKRQIASSYFHGGVIINNFYFEEGSINKIAASLKDYINEKGTWRFLEEYRNFLNTNTAWYRPCNPNKIFNWEQKIEITQNGKKRDVGLKSVILGNVLDKDPSNGVGGPCYLFFHEEAGIAPRMNETLEYLLPAMKSGMEYTGMFIAAGSVGDLEQCEPLRELIYKPDSKDVLAVKSNLLDENGQVGETGLFIPEQWSMKPCIDSWGNSMVEDALELIKTEREQWRKVLKSNDYQLRISQKPTNIKEAFDYRTASVFPLHLVSQQIRRIENGDYHQEFVELFPTKDGIEVKKSNKRPINEFPIDKNSQNKEGVIVVYERPDSINEFGSYYASVDPIGTGKTTTSDSLCSIYVYKTPQEIRTHKNGEIESTISGDKIVCSWTGRFDDINKTHERLELIIDWYKAWTVVENNVSLFITHMINKNKQKYLVPKSQIMFLKDIGANANVFQEYGWRNVGNLFKGNILSYGIQFLEEELSVITKPDGEIVNRTYGVERIPDIMLLKEMVAYRDGLNVDRLVAFCALVAFAKIQISNRGFNKKDIYDNNSLDNSQKNGKFTLGMFKNLEKNSKFSKSPFKNLK